MHKRTKPAVMAESNVTSLNLHRKQRAAKAQRLEPLVRFTRFPNQYAQSKRECEMTLSDLAKLIRRTAYNSKEVLPFIKLARFGDARTDKNCLRHNNNTLEIWGAETDYDGERITIEDAATVVRKANLRCLLYTSASYTATAPRWRLLAPASTALPPQLRARLVARLNGLFGGVFAGESFTLSTSYYFGSVKRNPAHKVIVIEGRRYIDECDDLDVGAMWKNGKPFIDRPDDSDNATINDSTINGTAPPDDPYKKYADEINRPPLAKVAAALEAHPNIVLANLDENYPHWIEIGMSIKSVYPGQNGLVLFMQWSATWPGYIDSQGKQHRFSAKTTTAKWKSFRPHSITIGTLFHFASEDTPGWDAESDQGANNKGGQSTGQSTLKSGLMQSSAEFVGGFVPPDYLIDGLLLRRFVYSFTGPTGSGKTAIILLVAIHVACGLSLAGRDVEKGRVLFFAGENPDDVRMRWIKVCEEMGVEPSDVDVVFMPFTPNLSEKKIRQQIDAEAAERGPFSLLIVDTSAAYYSGDDENDNKQLGAHARLLRSFVDLPGGPTVLVTCHPVKNPDMSNLLPRGGGAFLAEVDGNLVCINTPATKTAEVTTHGKFRGPEFTPFHFKLTSGQSEKLKDSKGRLIWTVTASVLTDQELEDIEAHGVSNQNFVLLAMLEQPGSSLSELAEHLGWRTKDGEPNKHRVNRTMSELRKAKLVEQRRNGHYTLTKKGEAEAEEFRNIVAPKPHGKGG